MERDPTKPVFYIVPPSWIDNLLPNRKGEEYMQAIVKEHMDQIHNQSWPVFYVIPKPFITFFFPAYKDVTKENGAPLLPVFAARASPSIEYQIVGIFQDCLSFIGTAFLVWAAILVE